MHIYITYIYICVCVCVCVGWGMGDNSFFVRVTTTVFVSIKEMDSVVLSLMTPVDLEKSETIAD